MIILVCIRHKQPWLERRMQTQTDKWLQVIKPVHPSFLYVKPFFVPSFKSETISTFLSFLFISSLFQVTSVKQKAFSASYPMAKMCIFSLNKASSSMSSVLTPSKIFARYSQLWVVSCFYPSFIILDRGLLRQKEGILFSFWIAIVRAWDVWNILTTAMIFRKNVLLYQGCYNLTNRFFAACPSAYLSKRYSSFVCFCFVQSI